VLRVPRPALLAQADFPSYSACNSVPLADHRGKILGNPSSPDKPEQARLNAQAAGDPATDPPSREFAHTVPEQHPDNPSDWWSESADGQCSESAALFAASQPAPLSIV